MSMEEDVKDIKATVKEIAAEQKEHGKTLLRNTVSLELHEKRTTLCEKRIDNVEKMALWLIGLLATSILGGLAKILLSH